MNCHCGHNRLVHDEDGCCMVKCKCKLAHDYTGKRIKDRDVHDRRKKRDL